MIMDLELLDRSGARWPPFDCCPKKFITVIADVDVSVENGIDETVQSIADSSERT